MTIRDALPIAIAHYSAIARRIVVPVCPYCGKAHQHMPAPDGSLQRMADCFRGEYTLDVREAKKP